MVAVGAPATDWANDGVFGDGWHLLGIGSKEYNEVNDEYTAAIQAVDAFLGEKVRPFAAQTVRAVGVVDVYEQVVFGSFCHEVLRPFLPLLCPDIDKARLDAFDPPLLVEREDVVGVSLAALAVDIQEDAYIMLLAVLYDGLEVESGMVWTRFPRGRICDIDLARVGFMGGSLAVPAPVEYHVVYAHGFAVVYHLVCFRCR